MGGAAWFGFGIDLSKGLGRVGLKILARASLVCWLRAARISSYAVTCSVAQVDRLHECGV